MNVGFGKIPGGEKDLMPFWLDAYEQSILQMCNDVIGDDKHSR